MRAPSSLNSSEASPSSASAASTSAAVSASIGCTGWKICHVKRESAASPSMSAADADAPLSCRSTQVRHGDLDLARLEPPEQGRELVNLLQAAGRLGNRAGDRHELRETHGSIVLNLGARKATAEPAERVKRNG